MLKIEVESRSAPAGNLCRALCALLLRENKERHGAARELREGDPGSFPLKDLIARGPENALCAREPLNAHAVGFVKGFLRYRGRVFPIRFVSEEEEPSAAAVRMKMPAGLRHVPGSEKALRGRAVPGGGKARGKVFGMESGERNQAGGHERIRQELGTIGRSRKARYFKITGSRVKKKHNDIACGASPQKRWRPSASHP